MISKKIHGLTTTKWKHLLSIIILYIAILILIFCVIFISWKTGIYLKVFTRDPAVTAGLNGLNSIFDVKNNSLLADAEHNPLVGLLSNIGILFWCSSASLYLFSFTILRNKKKTDRNQRSDFALFCCFFGFLTLMLLLDDLFLFHEAIFPNLLNISEEVVYTCYLAVIFFGIVRFRKTIVKTNFYLLLLAFLWFGFSIIIDLFGFSIIVLYEPLDAIVLFEDGFKLLGIVSWFSYCAETCFSHIRDITIFR